jgi:hypothetical protein
MTLTSEDLATLDAAEAAATPGPWTIEREGGPGVLVCDDVGDSVCRVSGNVADAEFIVLARTALPVLLETYRTPSPSSLELAQTFLDGLSRAPMIKPAELARLIDAGTAQLRVLAQELTTALDGVLGTESDEPAFEEKWDAAEVACDRAREVLGMKRTVQP